MRVFGAGKTGFIVQKGRITYYRNGGNPTARNRKISIRSGTRFGAKTTLVIRLMEPPSCGDYGWAECRDEEEICLLKEYLWNGF